MTENDLNWSTAFNDSKVNATFTLSESEGLESRVVLVVYEMPSDINITLHVREGDDDKGEKVQVYVPLSHWPPDARPSNQPLIDC